MYFLRFFLCCLALWGLDCVGGSLSSNPYEAPESSREEKCSRAFLVELPVVYGKRPWDLPEASRYRLSDYSFRDSYVTDIGHRRAHVIVLNVPVGIVDIPEFQREIKLLPPKVLNFTFVSKVFKNLVFLGIGALVGSHPFFTDFFDFGDFGDLGNIRNKGAYIGGAIGGVIRLTLDRIISAGDKEMGELIMIKSQVRRSMQTIEDLPQNLFLVVLIPVATEEEGL